MEQRTNRTFICSVLYADIVEYSNKSVEEQIFLKQRFNALLSEIIKDIAVNDRIILDTGDGAAIGFLGDPEDALFVAMELRDSIENEQADPSLPLLVRMGINLGPVKLITDINKQRNLIGDGINVAQRVMSFADPGKLIVSRSYYEVISCLSQEYAKLFNYEGLHADKHVREHGIYAVGHYESRQGSGSGLPVRRKLIAEPDQTVVKDHQQPPRNRSVNEQAPDQSGKMFLSSGIAQRLLHNKWLYAAIPLAVLLVLFIAFIWSGGKGPVEDHDSAVSVVTVPKPQTAVARVVPSDKKAKDRSSAVPVAPIPTPRTAVTPVAPSDKQKVETTISSTAVPTKTPVLHKQEAYIGFTLSAAEWKGRVVTLTVKLTNTAADERSVALYDDSFSTTKSFLFSYTKSYLTDGRGRSYDANEIYFQSGAKRITMHEAGEKGISIDGGATVTAHLVFKQIPDDSRRVTLMLRPYVYYGWQWTEHEMDFPEIALK